LKRVERWFYLGFVIVVFMILLFSWHYSAVQSNNLQKQIAQAELVRYKTLMEISQDVKIPLNNVFVQDNVMWAEWRNATYGEFLRVQKINEAWQILAVYYFYGKGTVYKAETNQSNYVRN